MRHLFFIAIVFASACGDDDPAVDAGSDADDPADTEPRDADADLEDSDVRDAPADGGDEVSPAVVAAFRSARDALRGEASVALSRIAGMRPPLGDFAVYLASVPDDASSRPRLDRLTRYFEALRALAAAAVAGTLSADGSESLEEHAGELRYQPTFLADTWTEGLVPFELPELVLVSLAARVDETASDEELADALTPALNGVTAARVSAAATRVTLTAMEVERALRWVKGEVMLERDGFRLYDNVSLTGSPDLVATSGFSDIRLLTSHYFFPYDTDAEAYRELDEVHEELITSRAQELNGEEPVFFVLDIEHWTTTGEERLASFEKLRQVAEIVHTANPSLVIGYYMLLPERNPNWTYVPRDHEIYTHWQERNLENAAILGPAVDVLFPSLYTIHFYEGDMARTQSNWVTFATESFRQCDVIGGVRTSLADELGFSYAKRALAYVWPQYHPNGDLNPRGWQFIEGSFFRLQLDTLRAISDGVVVWAGSEYPWNPAWEGDPESWWGATRAFLDED